jgi:hypothetical protein
MTPRLRASLIQSLPKNFQEQLATHYLWSLSREGIRNIEREEPAFTQGMAMYGSIDNCVAKSIEILI